MLNKPRNWENVKARTAKEQLPKGGYVVKILDAKPVTYQGKNGPFSKLEISFDVAEGEYKDFFANDYRNQIGADKKWRGVFRPYLPTDDGTTEDTQTQERFKGITNAIEESNPGYRWEWDETTLKGKSIGAVFQAVEWEYDGKTGWRTACSYFTESDKIRSGKYKVPNDKPLKDKKASAENRDYEPVQPSGEYNDLPF